MPRVALGLPKSSVSSLMRAMRDAGPLSGVGNAPRYRIGTLLFEIGRLHRQNSTLISLVDPALAEICRATGHTGYVSMLDGADVLELRMHPGRQALRVVTTLGSPAPAFATANGRVLLARLSDEEVTALHPGLLVPPSPTAPQTMPDLLARLAQIRRTGWCEAIDEAIPSVHSAAVTVEGAENAETLAFCLSFSAPQVAEIELQRMITMLTEAARRVAERVDDALWRSVPSELAA
jgi:DNA-binding IclR family transcriptional regulator